MALHQDPQQLPLATMTVPQTAVLLQRRTADKATRPSHSHRYPRAEPANHELPGKKSCRPPQSRPSACALSVPATMDSNGFMCHGSNHGCPNACLHACEHVCVGMSFAYTVVDMRGSNLLHLVGAILEEVDRCHNRFVPINSIRAHTQYLRPTHASQPQIDYLP